MRRLKHWLARRIRRYFEGSVIVVRRE